MGNVVPSCDTEMMQMGVTSVLHSIPMWTLQHTEIQLQEVSSAILLLDTILSTVPEQLFSKLKLIREFIFFL